MSPGSVVYGNALETILVAPSAPESTLYNGQELIKMIQYATVYNHNKIKHNIQNA